VKVAAATWVLLHPGLLLELEMIIDCLVQLKKVKRLLVSSAFDLEFWGNFNSIKFNCQVPTILPLASSLSSCC
jgi:hypothetical protein